MTSQTARIEAFSDGVFAIAITLLILEIKIPTSSDGHLSSSLIRQWPSYISFLASFAFIGIMWINHHRLFTHIRRSDNVLLILNLLLLLGVTSVPFPTAVLAANLGQGDQRTAAMLYSATYVFIAVVFNFLWRYATGSKHGLLAPDVDPAAVKQISFQYALGPVLYLISFALAWVSVTSSLLLNLTLACFFAIPPTALRRARGRGNG
jgi:uncharacterized membrane protein